MIARIENNIQTGQIKYFDSNNSEIEKSLAEAEIYEKQQAVIRDQQSPAYIEQQKWNEIRSKRNVLLGLSDWTQLDDYRGNKETWAIYRQELRDIPQTFSTSESVIWPSKP
jgi:hypothetical protein